MGENLVILAAFVFIYSLVSGGLEKTVFNGAIVFTAVGMLLGPLGLGILNLDIDAEGMSTLAELTLAMVLFTDAANANLKELKHSFRIPGRLLLIGLPLTILLGYLAGHMVFTDLSWLEIAILATMLAPTDAALGKAVVTNPAVPSNVRESLNVESGLNDGICVPILFVFLGLAAGPAASGDTTTIALKLVTQEIGIALAVAVVAAFAAAKLLHLCAERGWVTETWHQLPVPALALTCYATAQWLGGSGFIACFAAGMLFGWIENEHKPKLLLAAEGTGDTLALLTWVAFGATVIDGAPGAYTWEVLVYALLSLTIVRMLPVFLVLSGLQLRSDEKLFMGWFGPRGLASIVFAIIVLKENLPGGETISATVVCTIMLSIILHGLSANPLVAALGARLRRSGAEVVADK